MESTDEMGLGVPWYVSLVGFTQSQTPMLPVSRRVRGYDQTSV